MQNDVCMYMAGSGEWGWNKCCELGQGEALINAFSGTCGKEEPDAH